MNGNIHAFILNGIAIQPSALIPFPFGLFPPPPDGRLSFFLFFLCEKNVFKISQRTKQANFKSSFVMQNVSIYTYNPKNQINEFDVFVLSKGLNSGKPLNAPCPNCFVISCQNNSERDFYKTMLYALSETKYFNQFLVGSVIPFLRISDFRKALSCQVNRVQANPGAFLEDVQKVKLIEARQSVIKLQLQLLNDLKMALLGRHFAHKT